MKVGPTNAKWRQPPAVRRFAVRWTAVCALVVAASAATAVGEPGASPAELPTLAVTPEIQQILRAYERAWHTRDAKALAELFRGDGMALPNGSGPARGRASIEAEYARNAGGNLILRPVAFETSGRLAYIVGVFGTAPGQPELGKFVLVLGKADDGQWRIVADIDNMNAMPKPRP